jgi:hypothetical protein
MDEIRTRECKPQGNFSGACYNARNDKEEERFVTQLMEQLLGCCVPKFGQHNPLFLVRSCKNQQLAGNAAQHNKCYEKFLFLGRDFSHKIIQVK